MIEEFRGSYADVMRLAGCCGLSPVLTSRHPFKTSLEVFARIGEEEHKVRTEAQLSLARRAMFTHGLHVNVSLSDFPLEKMHDLVEKVNYYTPSLVPWSYSSPFYKGQLFDGLCSRNYFRASSRSMVDLNERRGAQVLEFRGFDACGDARLLEAVVELFCGLLLDESLPGRSQVQDSERLKRSSKLGFADPSLREEGRLILRAAHAALNNKSRSLDLLDTMLAENDSYAARMKSRFAETGCIMECISGQYDY
jgi:hypothetical protein